MVDRLSVDRFRRDWAAALGRAPGDGEPLALAVSGGPDSMAMLVLAAAAWPGQVIAATFDHCLRSGSADEAAMVGDWCAGRGIPHAILTPSTPLGTANVQAAARDARYAALEHWAVGRGAHTLATAHHADDQAETFLMRANRGSGLTGLAGIRARRVASQPQAFVREGGPAGEQPLLPPHVPSPEPFEGVNAASGKTSDLDGCGAGPPLSRGNDGDFPSSGTGMAGPETLPLVIIRPLLGWRRTELRTAAAAAGAPYVTDPSNTDERFDRARMRGFLADQSLLDPAQLARAASWCGKAEADLRAIGEWLWRERRRPAEAGEVCLDVADLPRAVTRRLGREAIVAVRRDRGIATPAFSDATNIEPFLKALEAGRSAIQGGVMATASATIWRFRQAPSRRVV